MSVVPTYFVLPTFEYLALDWEAKLGQLDELQSPLIYTEEGGNPSDKVIPFNKIDRRITRDPKILDRYFVRRSQIEANKHKNILFGAKFEYKRKNHLKKNYPFYVNVVLILKQRNILKQDLGSWTL